MGRCLRERGERVRGGWWGGGHTSGALCDKLPVVCVYSLTAGKAKRQQTSAPPPPSPTHHRSPRQTSAKVRRDSYLFPLSGSGRRVLLCCPCACFSETGVEIAGRCSPSSTRRGSRSFTMRIHHHKALPSHIQRYKVHQRVDLTLLFSFSVCSGELLGVVK